MFPFAMRDSDSSKRILVEYQHFALTQPDHASRATILQIEEGVLRPVAYQDTEHFRLTRDFLKTGEGRSAGGVWLLLTEAV